MSATLNAIRGELTNNCICHYCEKCEFVFTTYYGENECPECGTGDDAWFQGCSGECWEQQKEDFFYVFNLWVEATASERWYVGGHNLGWRRVSGHSDATTDPDKVLEYLGINGDYTLRYEFDPDEKTFTIVRSSHDEWGAGLQVYTCEACEACGEAIRQNGNVWEHISGYDDCHLCYYNGDGPHRPEGK